MSVTHYGILKGGSMFVASDEEQMGHIAIINQLKIERVSWDG
jgi:hypothetical protein